MDQRRMCPHCRAFITNKDRVCPYCNNPVGQRAVDARNPADILGGFIPHARFNTVLILLVNFGMYLASTLYSMKGGNNSPISGIDGRTLVAFGAKYVPFLAMGQWWRLVMAGFLHGNLLHILMNSWVLFDLGAQVEESYGASRMWVIYFISNICGFYLSAVWSPAVSVGASAALYGLIGAMLALGVRDRSAYGQTVRSLYLRWLIFGLILSLGGGIDMAAHVGGFIGGFGLAFLAGQPRVGSPVEGFWRAASWFCVLLTVVSFLKWYLWFRLATQ